MGDREKDRWDDRGLWNKTAIAPRFIPLIYRRFSGLEIGDGERRRMQSIIDANARVPNYEIIQHPLQRGEGDRSCLPLSLPPQHFRYCEGEQTLLTLHQRSSWEPTK